MKYPKLEELNCSNCTERSIEIHYHEFWQYIIDNYKHSINWTERLYWFYHDLKDFPKCPNCGKPTKFINLKTGYREFCSTKCMNSSKFIQEKKKETSRKNWGTDNPMQNKQIQNKHKETIINKYGVDNVFQLEETKKKIKQTCLKKYGVEHYLQLNYNKCRISSHMRSKNILTDLDLIGYTNDGYQIRKCPNLNCNKCSQKLYIIPTNILFDRKRLGIELCTNLLPVGAKHKSSIECQIVEILDKHHIEYIRNDRKVMQNKKELDFYIPSKNIAIECNGCYWHSSLEKHPSYHIQKYKDCHTQNIQLLSIWEDWVKTKPEIVESILLNKLDVCNNTIYARKTIIKEIDSKTCNTFLDSNHIQGRSAASVRLGLYVGDELVSVMTFSPPRVNMGGKEHKQQWELVRFCNKLNTMVVGGASKLLKYFIQTYKPESIVSFSMNDISDGNLYKTLGFTTDDKITQSYWYIEPGTYKRYHRSSFTKQAIVKKGWRDTIDSEWTEKQVMAEQGYFCIYDSGQRKWVLNL